MYLYFAFSVLILLCYFAVGVWPCGLSHPRPAHESARPLQTDARLLGNCDLHAGHWDIIDGNTGKEPL